MASPGSARSSVGAASSKRARGWKRITALLAATAITVVVAPGGEAYAHPHATIDQQVQISVGRSRVVVGFAIVPSAPEGTSILAHLDRDGDGMISDQEASAFARDVVAGATLTLDGERIALGEPDVTVPRAEAIASGTGTIRVTTQAPLPLAGSTERDLALDVGFDAFAPDWFVQPFLLPELAGVGTISKIERSDRGASFRLRTDER